MHALLSLVDRGLAPDSLIRAGIRRILAGVLEEQRARFGPEGAPSFEREMARWLADMRRGPIAILPATSNEQHYELPPAFFQEVLGPQLKYSSAYYPEGVEALDEAELAMLELTCARAGIEDGHEVLELGCGWGSLSMYMAAQRPGARVLAVSNSRAQRRFIQAHADARGLSNLTVITRDMNDFDVSRESDPSVAGRRFDRVVSVEMFEHMRNWEALLTRVAGWLAPGGRLFTHVFAHRQYAYPYEDRDASDWMARHFFTGGMMPSHDLMARVPSPLETVESWRVSGTHYARTLEAWLRNLDDRARAPAIEEALRVAYGDDWRRWRQRWRVFMMACAELFNYEGGREWFVSHRLMRAR